MTTLLSLLLSLTHAQCDGDFDPRGKIIGYSHPDGDPIYENLGPQVGNAIDGTPIFDKTGLTTAHDRGLGNVTGSTATNEPLYDGEKQPKYTLDGDRVTPLREKNKSKIPGWM